MNDEERKAWERDVQYAIEAKENMHMTMKVLCGTILAADAELKRLWEAPDIDRETVGRIMHESWTHTKRAQGFHHQSECYALDRYEGNGKCPKCHSDLIPWEQLPEGQKDINRHAFDDVLGELRRRAKEG